MKRSFFAVIALFGFMGLAACDTGAETDDIPPVEETEIDVEPMPAPAPMPADTGMMADTPIDTMGAM
ncbi:MAG: hypothetical protein ACRELV_08055 [Longimicrobiales bacterium]